jgi:hypothetical protein
MPYCTATLNFTAQCLSYVPPRLYSTISIIATVLVEAHVYLMITYRDKQSGSINSNIETLSEVVHTSASKTCD